MRDECRGDKPDAKADGQASNDDDNEDRAGHGRIRIDKVAALRLDRYPRMRSLEYAQGPGQGDADAKSGESAAEDGFPAAPGVQRLRPVDVEIASRSWRWRAASIARCARGLFAHFRSMTDKC